jgi:hypothetical protein
MSGVVVPQGYLHSSGTPAPTFRQQAINMEGRWEMPCMSVSPSVCPQNDEAAMVEAVALYNPVSFAFEVTEDFLMYKSGVYSR